MPGIAKKTRCPLCEQEGYAIIYQNAMGKHFECKYCGNLFSEDSTTWKTTDELAPDHRSEVATDVIAEDGWFKLGRKEFECPSADEARIQQFKETGQLPHPCNQCYKALMFWSKTPTPKDYSVFFQFLDTFTFPYRGKVGDDVAVFYFRQKPEMLDFLQQLSQGLEQFNIPAYPQWRRACKEYQRQAPHHWRNAKELKINSSK